jgi:hypothetical protein
VVYAVVMTSYFTLPSDIRDFIYSNAASTLGIYVLLELLGLFELNDEYEEP